MLQAIFVLYSKRSNVMSKDITNGFPYAPVWICNLYVHTHTSFLPQKMPSKMPGTPIITFSIKSYANR